ncbi:alpha-galactosidase isoform 1 [Gracilaria domingensis]|nr:alpha-galactosidase isoform 1 [Gracilaria domingensis]KAI0556861.1 alpha-galactosidase isoform 1 [Gracilaria domingensis]KAI0560641.1 alpha-galactosidase isoform 1 [Gracilaria domingensis]
MGDPQDDEEVIDGQDGCADVENSAMTALEEISRRRAEHVAACRMRNEEITCSDALRAACFIGKNRSFTSGFGTILQSILDGLHYSAPTVRVKSIKALSSIDNACRGLLCHLLNVFSYIEASCRDVWTLARDAAFDLIGRSLLQHSGPEQSVGIEGLKDGEKRDPVLMSKILSVVEKRLCDTATFKAEELCLEAETPTAAQTGVRIHEQLYEMLSTANIEYIKWDMNRHLTKMSSQDWHKERQGEIGHRFILGAVRKLFWWWELVRRRVAVLLATNLDV